MKKIIYAVLNGVDNDGVSRYAVVITTQTELDDAVELTDLKKQKVVSEVKKMDIIERQFVPACLLVNRDVNDIEEITTKLERLFEDEDCEYEYSLEIEEAYGEQVLDLICGAESGEEEE